MAGVFATWQPEYEAAGLALFPVDAEAKRPSVSRYLNVGTRISRKLVDKHGDATAVGFACGAVGRGRTSAITVLDVDAPSEKLLADALNMFGHTPVIIQTASGKFHAWYRHAGERRKIKVPDLGGPVDILGGGFALAPPSQSAKGEYHFIQGSLADVASLPIMRTQFVQEPEADAPPVPVAKVSKGARNDTLFRACMSHARICSTVDDLMRFAHCVNTSSYDEPLPHDEVLRTVASAWAKEEAGENWFGAGSRLVLNFADIDGLMQTDPDAFLLLTRLRREHEGLRPIFLVANAMHETMPGGGWDRKRFTNARARLEQQGFIRMVAKRGGPGKPARYEFQNDQKFPARSDGEVGRAGGRGVD